MPTIMTRTITQGDYPANINGVSLFNRKGEPKSRYSWKDKLQMLGATEDIIFAYADLFAPRKTHFSIRRASDIDMGRWFEGRGEVTDDLIAWHLLGARVPGRHPLWLAPRAWDWTRFVAIDVDRRSDEADFHRRCARVEESFRFLGVPPEAWLVVPTPSGGRHYYFFTTDKIRTADIAPTMAKIGITACKGKVEIFPSTSNGLRLPFGHIPNRDHGPDEWIRFIEKHRSGRLPLVNWEMCKHMAKRHALDRRKQLPIFPPEPDGLADPEPRRLQQRPKAPRPERLVHLGLSKADRQKAQRYEALLARPVESPAEIEDLLELGIRTEGSRHEAIMRLAWNFIFVRGSSEEDAAREITEWAYRTGDGISKDVQADVTNGGHKVEDDVKDLVNHFGRLRDRAHGSPCLFADAEVAAIQRATASLEPRLRFSRGRFLLEFLRFAKTHGWSTKQGWECCPAAEGIMRQWRGCSGTRYKLYLDWALAQRILVKTREKRQTQDGTGCPRTFLMHMPITTRTDWKITRDDALSRLKQACMKPMNLPNDIPSRCEKSDRYLVGFPTKEENSEREEKASNRNAEPVTEVNEETVGRVEVFSLPGPGPHGQAKDTTNRRENHAECTFEYANAAGAGGPGTLPRDPTNDTNGTRKEGGKHQGRAVCHLAKGSPECSPIGPTIQDLRHPSPGTIGAIPTRHRHRRRREGITLEQPAAEPVLIDPFTVKQSLLLVKVALAVAYPSQEARLDNHPNWPLIEAMALDPTYSYRQRSALLANPLHLSPSDLEFRKELIREYRDKATPISPQAGSASPPLIFSADKPLFTPPEYLNLSG